MVHVGDSAPRMRFQARLCHSPSRSKIASWTFQLNTFNYPEGERMYSIFDELELTIECPTCTKPIREQTARIKRSRAIRCDKCGRIDISSNGMEALVAEIQDTERKFPDLSRNLHFKLK
jgi:ribosomal protein S27E